YVPFHQPIQEVTNIGITRGQKLHAVRLTGILNNLLPVAGGIDPEDSAIGNVCDVQQASLVYNGCFEKGIEYLSVSIDVGPIRLSLRRAILFRKPSEDCWRSRWDRRVIHATVPLSL